MGGTVHWIFDIEADGFLDEVTKIHCLSYTSICGTSKGTLYTKKDIEDFFYTKPQDTFVGHYVVGYDFKVLHKIYGIERPKNFVDTLALAWWAYPNRAEYGLESFGEDFGIPKPKIDDWKDLTIEEYTHRCEEDVQINLQLYRNLLTRSFEIYND